MGKDKPTALGLVCSIPGPPSFVSQPRLKMGHAVGAPEVALAGEAQMTFALVEIGRETLATCAPPSAERPGRLSRLGDFPRSVWASTVRSSCIMGKEMGILIGGRCLRAVEIALTSCEASIVRTALNPAEGTI